MSRFQMKNCEHCQELMHLRRGSWDVYDYHSDLWLAHECDGTRAEKAKRDKEWSSKFVASWNAALDRAREEDRYGG